MGQRQKQHMGRSAGDDRELPGRDVATDDVEALETKAIRRDDEQDDSRREPAADKDAAQQ